MKFRLTNRDSNKQIGCFMNYCTHQFTFITVSLIKVAVDDNNKKNYVWNNYIVMTNYSSCMAAMFLTVRLSIFPVNAPTRNQCVCDV